MCRRDRAGAIMFGRRRRNGEEVQREHDHAGMIGHDQPPAMSAPEGNRIVVKQHAAAADRFGASGLEVGILGSLKIRVGAAVLTLK